MNKKTKSLYDALAEDSVIHANRLIKEHLDTLTLQFVFYVFAAFTNWRLALILFAVHWALNIIASFVAKFLISNNKNTKEELAKLQEVEEKIKERLKDD